MTPEEIKIVLDKHAAYTRGEPGGARANLSGADLSGADLYGANLYDADLSGANLYDADLSGANLYDADLSGAILYAANLINADLSGADLYAANLSGADLRSANLRGADLRRSKLYGALLRDADLENALLPHFQILPEVGSFIGWKKAKAADTSEAVLMLEIPVEAERTSTLVGRKCRASAALVVAAYDMNGNDHPADTFTGPYYDGITYRVGQYVECPDFDPDIRIECTRGIHFFLTRKEAEDFV